MDSEEDIINDSVTLILRLMNTQKVKVEDEWVSDVLFNDPANLRIMKVN